ncbi:hypothetical protein BO82DRAFT_126127 [Aspergillus uvarum CBS 121591]|uniref:Uncharacterized protein n=1 Tax=Aspergillus uvarum CBS 121591 TaxID=1448315 RepID=A0A319C7B0_9EURO|nr:hypothetical protein BO82DRAFT_126127 [Aspergillus uvarum CBS 121591]PYH79709.1 hypothetical protein BO82DRAFT_126127 [Aspergillus uvarum CBS 121591]
MSWNPTPPACSFYPYYRLFFFLLPVVSFIRANFSSILHVCMSLIVVNLVNQGSPIQYFFSFHFSTFPFSSRPSKIPPLFPLLRTTTFEKKSFFNLIANRLNRAKSSLFVCPLPPGR